MLRLKSSITTIALIVSAALSHSVFAETTVIHAGELLVTAGKSPLKKQTLVISDGKITELKAGFVEVLQQMPNLLIYLQVLLCQA